MTQAPTVCLEGHRLLGGHTNPFLRKLSPGRDRQEASRPVGVGHKLQSSKDQEEESGVGTREPCWMGFSEEVTLQQKPNGGIAGQMSGSREGWPNPPSAPLDASCC